jgi:phytoene dehydrogenase-like protein
MDWGQFVIMFTAIYDQGFCRPAAGVRRFIQLLQKRAEEEGVKILYGHEVKHIIIDEQDRVKGVLLTNERSFYGKAIYSSMGHVETSLCCERWEEKRSRPARSTFSFCEAIFFLKECPTTWGMKDTIAFVNREDVFSYRCPEDFINQQSAVICCPNLYGDQQDVHSCDAHESEGVLRVTFLANPQRWCSMDRQSPIYRQKKEYVKQEALKIIQDFYPAFETSAVVYSDIFTPHTIHRYTKHDYGNVYGSPEKVKNGKTPYEGLYLIGTDQGFLGIVGATLSGISMANYYGLGGSLL